MTVFKIGSLRIRLTPMMLFCCIIWFASGNTKAMLILFCVVLIHECAHMLVAHLLGFETQGIEIYPFGGAAEICGTEDFPAFEGLIAAAGPSASLFVGFLASKLPFLPDEFVTFSYSVALFNLIPIYPLDGGRILCSLLKSFFGEQKGHKYCSIVGIVLASLYLIYNIRRLVCYFDSSTSVMSVFMFTAALKSLKYPFRPDKREKVIKSARSVKIIRSLENEDLLQLSKRFYGNSFHVVLICDKCGNVVGVTDEKQILDKLIAE